MILEFVAWNLAPIVIGLGITPPQRRDPWRGVMQFKNPRNAALVCLFFPFRNHRHNLEVPGICVSWILVLRDYAAFSGLIPEWGVLQYQNPLFAKANNALFVFFRKPKHVSLSFKTNKPRRFHVWVLGCGGRGIRTPGGVTLNSFQDCRIRPLCHSSIAAANITKLFIKITAFFKFLNPLQSLKRDFWVMVRASLFLSENSYLPVYIRMPE